MNLINFFIERGYDILLATIEHIRLTGVAIILAVITGIPMGILITRLKWMARWILGAAGIIQTIPSLALLGFLLPIPIPVLRAKRDKTPVWYM